jgi:anti-anti-sigma factor
VRLQPSDEFDIKVHKLDEISIIIVHGEIDLANIHLLADAVDHAVCRAVPLLFDLIRVRYIDSSGLHFMRQVHEQCATKHIPFAMVTNTMVRRICGLLSLETVIPIFPSTTLARDHLCG